MKKITASELKKVNNQLSVIQNIESDLGKEALKKEVIIRKANADFEKNYQIMSAKSQTEQNYLQKILTELDAIYGPSQYNFSTGEITPLPPKKEEEKK